MADTVKKKPAAQKTAAKPVAKKAARKPVKKTAATKAKMQTPAAQNTEITPKVAKAPVKDKIKKLPAAAKAAPKKIVERTLEAAMKTVEKAAETEAQKAAKKAVKATAKARKAVQAVVKAQKAAIKAEAEAEAVNSAFPETTATLNEAAPQKQSKAKKLPVGAKAAAADITHATTSVAKRAAREIKNKIKGIISPAGEEIFYYERRQIILLTLVYAAVACLVWLITRGMLCLGMITNWFTAGLLLLVMTLSLVALASVVFVLIFPQKLAVVSREGIKIDHNEMLKWSDVALAEEKYTSTLNRRPIIALHLVAGAEYKLTFMQRLCRHNVFTPFSIPLYAMTPEDVAKIRNLVKRNAEYKDSRN